MHRWKKARTDTGKDLWLRHDRTGKVVAGVTKVAQGASLTIGDQPVGYVSVTAAKRACEELFPSGETK